MTIYREVGKSRYTGTPTTQLGVSYMIVLGFLLMLVAGAALIAVWEDGATGATATITVLDQTYRFSQLEFFLAGMATAAVLLIGLAMMVQGLRRDSLRRRRLREERVREHGRVARLESEKMELERRLRETRAADAAKKDKKDSRDAGASRDADRDGVPDGAERTTDLRDHDRLVAGGRHNRDGSGHA
jgi:hypothetical protein